MPPFAQCVPVLDDVPCAFIDVKPFVYVGLLVSQTQGWYAAKA